MGKQQINGVVHRGIPIPLPLLEISCEKKHVHNTLATQWESELGTKVILKLHDK